MASKRFIDKFKAEAVKQVSERGYPFQRCTKKGSTKKGPKKGARGNIRWSAVHRAFPMPVSRN
jgi:hypothetical protein